MKLQSLFLSFAMITTFPAAGCTVYSTPPPDTELAYAELRPVPPPPQFEIIPLAPGPEYVWVPGHHRWEGRRYVWVGGRYDRRPHVGTHYVRGHWEHRGRVTMWIDGHSG